ncbi:hypothetical protein phiPLPE_75 [Iodobacter phage PhiPLPE]|uniref:Uncharacterized protein n=1 Tax=Iodobacter phage PhiPLPE TaxID=551895 RepID=B5AX94_9CAUD|nr:hypothetical protein phiPLPE_75 [Iodobacter phage PhiPLPE]ACG60397.1 hypothetical protein phiPLPE_75 [Iodobacter phage PhiPLPE]
MSKYLIAHIGHSANCEHICWWKADSKGYTICIEKAGLYDEKEAVAICKYGICIAVKKDYVESLSKSTPYYRRGNGELEKLYDGENHVVIPNAKDEWAELMNFRIDCGKTEKPTPIGKKARSIYLPSWVIDKGLS